MKYIILSMLLMAVVPMMAQTDSTDAPIQERYTYDEGSKFVVNEENETEIINIKDAYVQFRTIEEIVFLTVLYNPSSIFKKKGVEEYRIDSEFFKDERNGVYQARGSRFNGEESLRDSYLFTFDPKNSQLTITNLSTDMVEFLFTGQHIPDMPEYSRRQQEVQKTKQKQMGTD